MREFKGCGAGRAVEEPISLQCLLVVVHSRLYRGFDFPPILAVVRPAMRAIRNLRRKPEP
jgi:hypothetical protein